MKVGIVHVPKSAGTALGRVLRERQAAYVGPRYHEHDSFPRAHVRSLGESKDGSILSVSDARAIYADHDIIVAHASAPFFRAAGADHVIAILREPRARLLSLYREWQRITDVNIAELGRRGVDLRSATGHGFGPFLGSRPLRGQIRGAIASYMCGFPRQSVRDRMRFAVTGVHDPVKASTPSRPAPVDRVFWSDQVTDLLAHLADIGAAHGPSDDVVERVRVGSAPADHEILTAPILQSLAETVRADVTIIDRLMDEGVLSRRDATLLDAEFVETAGRLGFSLSSDATDLATEGRGAPR